MRKGRSLELVVKDIKSLKLPNATITSPEFVRDFDTGTLREVDVSVRYSSDNNNFFIAIECRDRSNIQDITWVEQLISKKKSIGADVLIAVTSSSFSSSTRLKAFKNGVVLRDFRRFTANEIKKWMEETYIEIHSIQKMIKSISIQPQEEIILSKPLNQYTFVCEGILHQLSFDEFISLIAEDNIFLQVQDKLTRHGDKVNFAVDVSITKNISINIPPPLRIARVKMELIAVSKVQRVPLVCGFNYIDSTTDGFIAEGYSYDLREDDLFSSLLIDPQSNEGKWKLDFSKLKEDDDVIGNVVIKCPKPVKLTRLAIKVV